MGVTPLDSTRKILLDTAKGVFSQSQRQWKTFPLQQHHLGPVPVLPSPQAFFETLTEQLLPSAKHRVYLASLYIGPHQSTKETMFLQALANVPKSVDVKVVLDQNRALRQVGASNNSSAKAVHEALARDNALHLCSVLPNLLQSTLSNPYNEIAGVFHVKAYIIDQHLILSGANLSHEYFDHRVDRYLWIQDNAVVEWYAQLIQTLCQYGATNYGKQQSLSKTSQNEQMLLETLTSLLTDDAHENTNDDNSHCNDDTTVAYATPTLQGPPHWRPHLHWPNDAQTIHQLVQNTTSTVRIASAYLNPTNELKSALRGRTSYALTAAYESHGFAAKRKTSPSSHHRRDWIPAIYDTTARTFPGTVSWYRRPDWTFHAKGLWLGGNRGSIKFDPQNDDLLLVTHGSGNFGARSQNRDMESHVHMVLPPGSSLIRPHQEEWNELCAYAITDEPRRNLSWPWRKALPLLRTFF